MKVELTTKEAFALGCAYDMFFHGDIDGAIHMCLPSKLCPSGELENQVFMSLYDRFEKIIWSYHGEGIPVGSAYMKLIQEWAEGNDIDLGLEFAVIGKVE